MNLINIDEPNKKSFTSKCLGIDFGTTNSVCSIKIGEKVIFIEDSKKMNLIPSIVCFDKTVKVGNDIDLEKNLQTSIFSIKRYFTDNPDGQIVINSKSDLLPKMKEINQKINDESLIVEFLEKTEKTFSSISFDIKNIIEIMKMEQL